MVGMKMKSSKIISQVTMKVCRSTEALVAIKCGNLSGLCGLLSD